MHVKVELWMSMGKALGEGFQSPSEMVSRIGMSVEEGTTLKKLFDRLAEKYPPIAGKIFDRKKEDFYPNLTVLVTSEGRIQSFLDIPDINGRILKDGDQIKVLPLYAGG
ncbi:MAG: MoaD/ThiS family protein [Thermodesulfobacteriota bacterium]|jgi:molybdopterin converting factor small subunit